MATPLVIGLVEFLHNVFTVFWIGGLFTLAFVVMPAIKSALGLNPGTKKIVVAIRSRLNKIVWISIVGLILTGIPLSISNSGLFTGFFSLANTYSLLLTLKHIIVILMVIVVIIRASILPRMSDMTPQKNEKMSALLMMINVILGFVVLLISGILATTPVST